MIGADEDGVFVGTFVGFRKINPLSTKITALFKGDERTIGIPVDYRQQAFIQKEHLVGSKVALGYYGGEWHIGSKPIQHDVFLKTPVVH
jgi:hypothetical protein